MRRSAWVCAPILPVVGPGFGAVRGGVQNVQSNILAERERLAALPGLDGTSGELGEAGHNFLQWRAGSEDGDDEMLWAKIVGDHLDAAVIGAGHLREDETFEAVDAVKLQEMPGGRRRGAFLAGVDQPRAIRGAHEKGRTVLQWRDDEGRCRRVDGAKIGDIERSAGLMGEKSDEEDENLGEKPVGVVKQRGQLRAENRDGDAQGSDHGDQSGPRDDKEIGED